MLTIDNICNIDNIFNNIDITDNIDNKKMLPPDLT